MLVTFDFETYYDSEYTLRKMTPVEYILDPRFETIGCAVKEGRDKPVFLDERELWRYLKGIDAKDVDAVSHNALFDMCILAWRFGFVPRLMIDTIGMSRALLSPYLRSVSLDAVTKFLKLPPKGDTVHAVKGMNARMIREAGLWDAYAKYSCDDADSAHAIFGALMKRGFPKEELLVVDTVLRCAVMPNFRLDTETLYQHLGEVLQAKDALMSQITADKDTLMSNERFAQALKDLGVDPPTKTSLATGKETWAFSKTDVEFNDLQEHEDPRVQALVSARLGIKSTLEETRTQRLIAISQLEWAGLPRRYMPIPLKYSGAHTHRLSGDWKLNMQNLPRGGNLRKALRVTEKQRIVAVDASQIEARLVAWFAGQLDLIEAFAQGADVYSKFASSIYGFEVNKKDNPVERFVGKQCLAEGTLVVTERGLIPIQSVTTNDRLWDGEEWVCHQGLLDQGIKDVETCHGLTATGDHEILTEHGWRVWNEVHTNPSHFQSALSMVSLPLPSGCVRPQPGNQQDGNQLYVAPVDGKDVSTGITLKQAELRGAILVQKLQQVLSVTGHILQRCLTTNTAPAYSIVCPRAYLDAITTSQPAISTTVCVGSKSTNHGVEIKQNFFGTFKHWMAGISHTLKWIGSTWTRVTYRVTFGLSVGQKICQTSAVLKTLKHGSESLKHKSVNSGGKTRVFDLANAGPRHRFTVMTDAGPVIVSNCILGLGYGLGWKKFMRQLRVVSRNQTGKEIVLTDEESRRIVGIYREMYFMIPMMWRVLNAQLPLMTRPDHVSNIKCVSLRHEHIMGPCGLPIRYHNLRNEDDQWIYDFAGKTKRIYGGAALENIIQHLARIHVMDAALRVRRALEAAGLGGIRLALQAHDELVYVTPERHARYVHDLVMAEMTRRPAWAQDAPLTAEGGIGLTYADAK